MIYLAEKGLWNGVASPLKFIKSHKFSLFCKIRNNKTQRDVPYITEDGYLFFNGRPSWNFFQATSILMEYYPAFSIGKHTGWYILSSTTAIPHMVRQGDALVYYLCVFLLTWNILTHTNKVMSMNKLGKMCDVMWMVSEIVKNNRSIGRRYLVKNSHKCIKIILKMPPINMFYQNLQKNFTFSGIFDSW